MNSNDKKYKKYKLRKILRILIMIFSIVTIVLAVLNLAIKISIVYALISFLITTLLTNYRNKISLNKKDSKK